MPLALANRGASLIPEQPGTAEQLKISRVANQRINVGELKDSFESHHLPVGTIRDAVDHDAIGILADETYGSISECKLSTANVSAAERIAAEGCIDATKTERRPLRLHRTMKAGQKHLRYSVGRWVYRPRCLHYKCAPIRRLS